MNAFVSPASVRCKCRTDNPFQGHGSKRDIAGPALAQLLYGHGANILDADQHRDLEAGEAELHTDRVALEHGIAEVGARLALGTVLSYSDLEHRILVSGNRTVVFP